ncbi:bifunctional tetrahydrofolate synthase/dihydrofolate synthase [Rhodanobacter sp. Col0626]|uniref:bifunctional tetrahydrofolate synthase/dihydrofolate synthase n=1 Tax=Rhodanobacter sp. Col0626 TaxID=3415679 RepID=UPI003CF60A77
MSRTLCEWLSYQERVNVHSIELGLDRVREVWQRMGAPAPAKHVITVGGTNGKGSTVALLEAISSAAGLHVGAFTSPHLLVYNERVRIDGANVDDAALVASFERIEAARGSIPLTYFEFGTLAALDLFARAGLDIAVLEVGLGGRLDAVNIIDADVAVITTVDLDHMDWLGPDRDSIGREKAGIARAARPAIVGEPDPPAGLLDALAACGARVERAGIDFQVERHAAGWRWRHRDGVAMELPDPALAAPIQFDNAAAAIAALHALWLADASFSPKDIFAAISAGLHEVRVPARLQSLGGDPALIVDVGHNPQAARALAEWLDAQPPTGVHAVYGALADKDVAGVIAALGARIEHWHLAGLDHATPRGLAAAALAGILQQTLPDAPFDAHPDVATALAAAGDLARPGQRILAFGSFFVAGAVIAERSS